MHIRKSKLSMLIILFIAILIMSSGCTVDSFGIEQTRKSYTRMNEEARVPNLVDESRFVNWVLKKEDINDFSIYDDLTFVEKVMINNSFAGLFEVVDSKVKMDLVKTVSVSETGREYTFELRDSKWSNGDKISAYDIIDSWNMYNEKSGKNIFSKIGIEKAKALDNKLINIKLFRSNDKLMYYLSDLSYKLYPKEVLEGAVLTANDSTIGYSGKYEIRLTDDIESLKLIKNNMHYASSNHYINEVHIIADDVFSNSKNDRYEFYIDSSQDIAEYEDLLASPYDFNYVAAASIKSIIINPNMDKLSNKYDRIKLIESLDVKGVSDYSSKGLATVVDTFAIIDNWKFDYGYLEESIISKQSREFDFEDLKLSYIDSSENQMIYEILSLMLKTTFDINLISDPLNESEFAEKIESSDYELMIKNIDKIGVLSDSYLLNLENKLPESYDDNFDYNYKDNLKKYQHTSDIKYLKKAELDLKLKAYISPLYNCGFPILGDERLDLRKFYNSEYLDFSTIKYNQIY